MQKNSEDNTPATIPFSLLFLEEITPQMNPPNKTEIIKYTPDLSDKVGDFDKTTEKINVSKTLTTVPTAPDTAVMMIFCIGIIFSLLFLLLFLLCIKNPLTFNKEYEGENHIMI